MLSIRRKFTLGVSPNADAIISSKLEELQISSRRQIYIGKLGKTEIPRLYFDCTGDEDKYSDLVLYLKGEYNGFASITY